MIFFKELKSARGEKLRLLDTQHLLLILVDTAPFLKDFTLMGDSALALHLCHRKSEDLDFFTYCDRFNKEEFFNYLSCFNNKEVINQTDE